MKTLPPEPHTVWLASARDLVEGASRPQKDAEREPVMASYHLDTAKVVLNSAEILWRNIIETPAKTPAGIAAQVEAIRYFNGATPSDSIVSIGFETVLKSLQQLED